MAKYALMYGKNDPLFVDDVTYYSEYVAKLNMESLKRELNKLTTKVIDTKVVSKKYFFGLIPVQSIKFVERPKHVDHDKMMEIYETIRVVEI